MHEIVYAGVGARKTPPPILSMMTKIGRRCAVHCEAGISRSTAVAAAIAEHHGQSVGPFFTPPCHPNPHVFHLMRNALAAHT